RRGRQPAADASGHAGDARGYRGRPYPHLREPYWSHRHNGDGHSRPCQCCGRDAAPALVRTMRRPSSSELVLVPAIIITAHANPALVADALRSGAHQVLALPTSAVTLARRLDWLLNDDRPFELKGDHYVVSGIEVRLAVNYQRPAQSPAEVTLSPPRSACEDKEPLILDLVETARVARN